MCHGELQDNSSWFLWLALFNQRGRTNEIPWWHLWTYLRRARPERNQSALITVWLITMPAGYELCPTQTDVKASREPGNAITLLPHQLHVWWETICSGLSLELFGLKVQQQIQYSPFFFGSWSRHWLGGHILQIKWLPLGATDPLRSLANFVWALIAGLLWAAASRPSGSLDDGEAFTSKVN